jgi:hypothetical protein
MDRCNQDRRHRDIEEVGERETTDRKEVERGRFGEKKEDGRKERIGGCVRKRK